MCANHSAAQSLAVRTTKSDGDSGDAGATRAWNPTVACARIALAAPMRKNPLMSNRPGTFAGPSSVVKAAMRAQLRWTDHTVPPPPCGATASTRQPEGYGRSAHAGG